MEKPTKGWLQDVGPPLFHGVVHAFEELRRLQSKRVDDLEDVHECKIVLASLDAAHVTSVDSTGIAERLLRKPALFPQPPDDGSETNKIRNLDFCG